MSSFDKLSLFLILRNLASFCKSLSDLLCSCIALFKSFFVILCLYQCFLNLIGYIFYEYCMTHVFFVPIKCV